MPRSRIGKIVQLLSTKQTLHKMLLFQVQSLKQFQLVSKTTSKQVFFGQTRANCFSYFRSKKKIQIWTTSKLGRRIRQEKRNQTIKSICIFKLGHSRPLFFIFLFSIDFLIHLNLQSKSNLTMTGFELQISGVRCNRSTN